MSWNLKLAQRVCAAAVFGAALSICAFAAPGPSRASTIEDFLGDPAVSFVRISPTGKFLAMVKSDGDADALVVRDLASNTDRVLLKTKPREAGHKDVVIRQRIVYLSWKGDDRLLMTVESPYGYDSDIQRVTSNIIVHLAVKRDGSGSIALNHAPVNGRNNRYSAVDIVDTLPNDPSHVLIGREDGGVDRVDITDGKHDMVESGGPLVLGYSADKQGNLVTRMVQSGSEAFPVLIMQGRAPGEKAWTHLWEIGRKDLKVFNDIEILAATSNPGVLWVKAKPKTAADGDTYSIRTYDLRNQFLGPVVWSNPKYDVSSIIVGESSGKFMGACYIEDVEVCEFNNPNLGAQYRGISKFFEGRANVDVVSRTDDDTKWVLRISSPEEPESYYLFDSVHSRMDPIGGAWPRMQAAGVGQVQRFDYKARDGYALSAYVTSPPGKGPRPLVVMPHGGPEARDSLDFDIWAQYLASRGYVVLQPNFRGSTGFGEAFIEAGYHQWGGRMQDDVTDAVKALIATGAVDANRVCVVGASYGGYVALYAAATQGDLYKCAVSIDGVSDLAEAVGETRRDYGADSETYKHDVMVIGDPGRDRDLMSAKSPVRLAAQFAMPVLIIHGDKDDIVSVDESRQMNRALQAASKPVSYIEIKGMAHGPVLDKETREVLPAVADFLDSHIGPAAPAH